MKILVGLGNPGKKYEQTRHNAGFMLCDQVASQLHLSWKEHKKSEALYVKTTHNGQDLFLIKPMSFMNRSGQPVRSLLSYFDIVSEFDHDQDLGQLYVAHDDLDINVGNWKKQKGKGPKGHNGLLSLYQTLHSNQFWHLRIGVDGRGGDRSTPPDAYVLQQFLNEEKVLVDQSVKELIESFLSA